MKRIAILGDTEDFHAVHLHTQLQHAGEHPFLLDFRRFPETMTLNWNPVENRGELGLGEETVAFDEIKSVYWRSLNLPDNSKLAGAENWIIAQMDSLSMVKTFLREPAIRWVNGHEAYEFHRCKPRQLSLAKQIGARVPLTLTSNDAIRIQQFARQLPAAIFKPVQGGAHTERLTAAMLAMEHLQTVLALSPVTIQEYIAGTNIRTYVLGDQVYSAEIRSDSTDFREDETALVQPLATPDAIRALSLEITRRFSMQWTAIDWRRNAAGEYYFLEANPSPMFHHFERCTDYPITRDLMSLLRTP